MTNKKTIKHILNVLRRGTITWEGRYSCLKDCRVLISSGITKDKKPKFKYHYKCNKCETLFRNSTYLQVDHIEEVGSFNGDFNEYIARMYCHKSNLQALCVSCHAKKTSSFNASLIYKRKNLCPDQN